MLAGQNMVVVGELWRNIPMQFGKRERLVDGGAVATIRRQGDKYTVSFDFKPGACKIGSAGFRESLSLRTPDGGLLVATTEVQPEPKPGFDDVVTLDARLWAATMLLNPNRPRRTF